jgi:hypothetical protein
MARVIKITAELTPKNLCVFTYSSASGLLVSLKTDIPANMILRIEKIDAK